MDYETRFDVVVEQLPFLINAALLTLMLMAASFILAIILGIVAGQMRMSRRRLLRWPATVYIDFWRTTPLLVQLIWIFFVLPIVFGIRLSAFQSGVLALGLNYGAFFAEIFRAGITSLGRGQSEAGSALGLTGLQVQRRVIYPQALWRMLPPIGSMTVSLLKDTSLVTVIGIAELMNAAQNLTAQTFRPLEVLTVVAIMYFVMTYPIALVTDLLYRRSRMERPV